MGGGSKGGYERDPYGGWNPEQTGLGRWLGPWLQNYLSQGPERYKGDFTAPLTPQEEELQKQAGELGGMAQERWRDLMSGKFQEEYFESAIYQPMTKRFKEDIQPLIEE